MWKNFNLLERVKTATVVGEKSLVETNNRGEQCLIVRLLTSKSYNKEAIKTAMLKHWRPIFKLSDCSGFG